MLFNSLEFLWLFLPISVVGYFLLGKLPGNASRVWLCLMSFGFYAWWNPAFLVVLVASILFNFGLSLLIARAGACARGRWLALGVAGNLAALGWFKYASWLAHMLIGLGVPASAFAHSLLSGIALPLGISFFTFTQIGYLIDVKEGVAKERGFLNYVLFVTFFPHLIAGPILHHREIMPQFADRGIDRFNVENFGVGLTLFLAGLFKKTMIADNVAPIVGAGFARVGDLGAAGAWLTILAYVLQLYFDFSGYSDMAVGIARIFNIRFPLNFNSPYKAQNIADFWQRWHITLTRYLNAYLYNPLAMKTTRAVLAAAPKRGNPLTTPRGVALTVAVPTFWTMTLAGIWHGAGPQFVIFGLLHSAYITAYRGWATWGRKRRKFTRGAALDVQERCEIAGAVLLTLLCVAVADVFFRAPDVASAVALLRAAAGLNAGAGLMTGDGYEWAAIALLFAVVWAAPNLYEMLGEASPALVKLKTTAPALLRWQPSPGWAAATGLVGAVAIMAIGRATTFLYFQF